MWWAHMPLTRSNLLLSVASFDVPRVKEDRCAHSSSVLPCEQYNPCDFD